MSTSIPVRSNGQTIDATWFNVPRSEISVLDDRVDALGSGNHLPFNVFGRYANGGSVDQLLICKITQSITMTSATLKVMTAGSTGSTKVSLQRKRGSGSWIDIFTTVPIVPASAGSYQDSDTATGAQAAVMNSSMVALVPGDLVCLNQQQVPTGTPDTYTLTVYYTVDGV